MNGSVRERGGGDQVAEVRPPVAGQHALQDVGLDVAERRLGLVGDAVGEGPDDVRLEVLARVGGQHLLPRVIRHLGETQPHHVQLYARRDQRHFRLFVPGDPGGGVQGDRIPDERDDLFGYTMLAEELAGRVGTVRLEPLMRAPEPLGEAQVVEDGPEVEQLRVERQPAPVSTP
jgi:hypothetical protein